MFAWIEASSLSTWIREADTIFAFQGILVLHALGMGFLAGGNAAIDLRVLGVARRVPLASMAGFFSILWLGFGASLVSGVLLLIAYPTKALTNPLFYVKLGAIALAIGLMPLIRDRVLRGSTGDQDSLPTRAKALAAISLLLWVMVIGAGRLLAYTYSRLMAYSIPTGF
jgi:uncharacterized protein DUF6644